MSKLFQPWKINQLNLKNRIVIAPMCQYSAADGMATDWHTMHYGSLSHSGAGLLIFEATAVEPRGRISWGDLGLYNDQCEVALKKLITQIKQHSSIAIAVQLAHAGRKASCNKPWAGGGQIAPTDAHGWQTVAPSELPFNEKDKRPLALTIDEMQTIKTNFVESAQRAVRAGFQGVEIHAAHGYLLHEFLSPISNQRQDQYGGSLENRMRFPLEVFKAVYDAVAKDIAVWIRISASDWVANGWNVDESVIFAKKLKELGCEVIHVSSGGLDINQKIPVAPNYQVSFSEKIKHEVKIETIAVGLITEPQQAEEILQSQKADAIGLARAILYNPRWPWHAAAALGDSVLCPPQYLRSQPHGISKTLLVGDRV